MARREISIDLHTGDWFIEFEPHIQKTSKMCVYLESPFAYSRMNSKGEIIQLFDTILKDEWIIQAKKHGKEFLEVCDFVYVPRDYRTAVQDFSKEERFTGDFIDALIFTQKILKEYTDVCNESFTKGISIHS